MSGAWQNRIVGQGLVEPSTLEAHPERWRVHPPAQERAVEALLAELGWVGTLVVSQRTNRILNGHLLASLASRHGEAVPVTYVELNEDEERLFLAAFDPVSALATMQHEALDRLLRQIEVPDGALRDLLASLAEQARRGLQFIGRTLPDDVPAEDVAPAERGRAYRLGRHTLYCGDATVADGLSRVLAGERPRAYITDMPFGVADDPAQRGSRHRPIANDDLPPEGIHDLLVASLLAAQLAAGAAVYVVHADTLGAVVRQAFPAAGIRISACLIWVKPSPVLGRGDYHWQHEPILYGAKQGGRHRWHGDRRETTVWQIAGPVQSGSSDPSGLHPHQKPVALIERALRNSTLPGELVIDPFLGSGTTLIAAERTDRRCLGVELDPVRAGVAIARWERYTGQTAEAL